MNDKFIKKPIFIINGYGRSGKDEFIKACNKIIPSYNVSSVDHIKEALKIICPTYKNDLEKYGNEIGDIWRNNIHDLKVLSIKMDDGPFKIVKNKIDWYLNDVVYEIMFIHIREPEEIDKILNNFECKTLLIENSNIRSLESLSFEKNVINYNYDIIIDNNGSLDDLYIKAKEFISKYC